MINVLVGDLGLTVGSAAGPLSHRFEVARLGPLPIPSVFCVILVGYLGPRGIPELSIGLYVEQV